MDPQPTNSPPRRADQTAADWLNKRKFITYEDERFGPVMMIFPETEVHYSVAVLRGISEDSIQSAGFISSDFGGVYCHGRSTSIKPNPPDAREIDTKIAQAYADAIN